VWPAVLAALRTQLAARPGYRLPTDTAPLGATTVLIGSESNAVADPGDWIALGVAEEPDATAGTWSQEWRTAGPAHRGRDETGEIEVLVSVHDGSPDRIATMQRAFAVLAGLELVIAGAPDLGLVPTPASRLVLTPPSGGSIAWGDGERGSRCLLRCTVSYGARLTGVTA
jgi:hypothetical protein